MRIFADERNGIITERELLREFNELRAAQPDEYNYSFERHIQNCTAKNGTLEELNDTAIGLLVTTYARLGCTHKALEIGRAWYESNSQM